MALPTALNVRLLAIAALFVAIAAPNAAQAQPTAYPKVEIRQDPGTGPGTSWGGAARVRLDRDAFLVVIELGVDGRARVVFPESPRQKAFVRATRSFLVPLPSADVMFVNVSQVRRPTVLAFASDMAPDLTEFTQDGGRWDYQFAMDADQRTEDVIRDLATLIYGDPDMPFSVSQTRVAPVLSAFAQRALLDCGYSLGGLTSADFLDFLWDVYGPLQYQGLSPWGAQGRAYNSMTGSNVFWGYVPSSYYMPFPLSSFRRSTSSLLWNRYGAGCNRWGFRPPLIVAVGGPPVVIPPAEDTVIDKDKPKDRPAGDPNDKVDGVGIVPATPAEMQRRATKVSAVVSASSVANTKLAREAHNELLQRREVAAALQMLATQRVTGLSAQQLQAQARRAESAGGAIGRRFPSSRGDARTGGLSPSYGTGSGGSTGMGGGSSEVGGSGGAGSSGESRGGSAGGGRAGSGRVPPGQ